METKILQSELHTITIISYNRGITPVVNHDEKPFSSVKAAQNAANIYADAIIKAHLNEGQKLTKTISNNGNRISVCNDTAPVVEYHITKIPVYDPSAIASVTKTDLPDDLERCLVKLCSGEILDVIYHVDENDEWTFFYPDGKKPNDPDFEHNLICSL